MHMSSCDISIHVHMIEELVVCHSWHGIAVLHLQFVFGCPLSVPADVCQYVMWCDVMSCYVLSSHVRWCKVLYRDEMCLDLMCASICMCAGWSGILHAVVKKLALGPPFVVCAALCVSVP